MRSECYHIVIYMFEVIPMGATASIHHFFDNIRYLRRKYGLTPEEMAALLRIDVRTLLLLEKGILSDPLDISFLERVSQEFHIPFVDLFRPLDNQ